MGVNFGSYLDYWLLGQSGNVYVFINWLPTAVHTLLAALHYLVDQRGLSRGIFFFQVVGMNSILIYLFFDIVGRRWFNTYATQLLSPLHDNFGLPVPLFLIVTSLGIFAAEWGLCYFLYRKNIFFKL